MRIRTLVYHSASYEYTDVAYIFRTLFQTNKQTNQHVNGAAYMSLVHARYPAIHGHSCMDTSMTRLRYMDTSFYEQLSATTSKRTLR